jgi:hypothetical protein
MLGRMPRHVAAANKSTYRLLLPVRASSAASFGRASSLQTVKVLDVDGGEVPEQDHQYGQADR